LLNGGSLVDLARRIVLWQYKGGSDLGKVIGGRYLYVASGTDHSKTLAHAALPHGEAKQLAASLQPESLLVIKPGARIAVQVEVALGADEQEQIQQALVRKLTENGVQVAADANIVLRATTEEGKTDTVEYRTIGRGFGTQSATVTQQIQKLTFTENGEKLWEAMQVKGAPIFVHTKGKDLNTAIAEQTKPSVAFFISRMLPKYLARPGSKTAGAYGESSLTAQGVQ
jgi:hypothetical protein